MSRIPPDVGELGGHANTINEEGDDANARRPRRPLPLLVIAYAFGILIGALTGAGMWIPAVGGMLFLAASRFLRSSAFASSAIHCAAMFAGWAVIAASPESVSNEILRARFPKDRVHVDAVARIVSQPVHSAVDEDGPASVHADALLESVSDGRDTVDVHVPIRLNMYAENMESVPLRYGQRWRFRGVLQLDDRPVHQRGAAAGYLNAYGGRSYIVDTDAGSPVVAWCFRMREVCRERLGWGRTDDDDTVALVRALLLGYRDDVPSAVHEAFARTGTLHVLALSGMHVGILVLLVTVLLRGLGIPRTRWLFFLAVFLAVYTVATGGAASTVRASIMACTFFAAWSFRRQADAASSLALAALVILVMDPYALFSLGFILSFTVVAGLVALYPVVSDSLMRTGEGAEWVDPESPWLSARKKTSRRMLEMFAVSVAAWLASTPLIACAFNLVSPVALVVNLLILPLAAVILTTAGLSLLSGLISYQLAATFNSANALFGQTLMSVVDWSARIPWGYRYVASWHGWVLCVWFVILIVLVAADRRVRPAGYALLIAIAAISMTARTFSKTIEIVAVPAGRAMVLMIDGPGDRCTLIDSGSSYSSRSLTRRLHERGIGAVDSVIISRATRDAYGGVPGMAESFDIKRVVIPRVTSRQYAFLNERSIWQALTPRMTIADWPNDAHIALHGGIHISLLHPGPSEGYRSALDSALIARISRGAESVLFMGHAGERIEGAALLRPIDWNADTLVVGRPGGADALTAEWMDAVSPLEVAVNAAAFDRIADGEATFVRGLADSTDAEVTLLSRGAHLVATF